MDSWLLVLEWILDPGLELGLDPALEPGNDIDLGESLKYPSLPLVDGCRLELVQCFPL